MLSREVVRGRTEVDVSGWAPGLYLVRLGTEADAVTRRVVVR
ncbi:MAG: T9SS type A sorting domain-containing protein [Bacteroidota bacterium]